MIKEPTVFIGAEAQAYSRLISQALGSPNGIRAIEDVPRGSAVALLAATCLENGKNDDALSLAPLYLKESTAKAFVNRYSRSAQVKD